MNALAADIRPESALRQARAGSPGHRRGPSGLSWLVFVLALAAGIAAVWGGPPLGDHEGIVAQCARNMRISGDWTVPELFATPFIRKPPLPYWLVAAASYLFPNDPQTGLPVTTACARFPSGLAAFGTILLIWKLGSLMFGRGVGLIAGLIASSNVFVLLYAPNATVEMILTFCCTWACLHLWCAVSLRRVRSPESRPPRTPPWQGGAGNIATRRALHMLGFYIALGFAMLAKGPAPLAMVAFPMAVWWYTEVPLRIFARKCRRELRPHAFPVVIIEAGTSGGAEDSTIRQAPADTHPLTRALRLSAAAFLRGIWPRTTGAFTQLWLIPGLLVFAALFVPWMMAVAHHHPHAWQLWNWQYLQRAAGEYEDSRPRGPFYYLPYVIGMLLPWLFLLPEAALAPWLKRYAHVRRPLLYAGLWALVSITVMSIEPFKKPYYIAPAMPALILMMAAVAYRFYVLEPLDRRWAQRAFAGTFVVLIIGVVAGRHWLYRNEPEMAGRILAIAIAAMLLIQASSLAYVFRRGWLAMAVMALASVVTFNTVWYLYGPRLGDLDDVTELAHNLDVLHIPHSAKVYWADKRPDARLNFYYGRESYYLTEPAQIVSKMVDRTGDDEDLQEMALENAQKVMSAPEPAYLLVSRRTFRQMERFAGVQGQVLGVAARDAKRQEKDLLIVANTAHATQSTQPSSKREPPRQ